MEVFVSALLILWIVRNHSCRMTFALFQQLGVEVFVDVAVATSVSL